MMVAFSALKSDAASITNLIALEYLEAALLARDGRPEEAEQKARIAVELSDMTDHFNSRAYARLHLATILIRAGREEDALQLAAEGFRIFEAKGDVTGLAATRRPFADLAPAADG